MPEINSHSELVDISEVSVDKSLPKHERIAEYIRQIKDPYHYKCNGRAISAKYAKGGPSFEECLRRM